jgi:hypothetical protein
LCFFLIANCSERKAPPKAVKGVLDLRDWDFDSSQDSGSDGIVKLGGEWEFYWEEFPKQCYSMITYYRIKLEIYIC